MKVRTMAVFALVAVMTLPVGVSGATASVEELQVQLQQLQKVVAELQLQVSRLPYGLVKQTEEKSVQLERKIEKESDDDDEREVRRIPSVQACRALERNFRVGDSGSEVRLLKQYLAKEGFAVNDSEKFDEATASAVSGFQQKYATEILAPLGLQYGTGFFGAATRAKMNALYRCGVVVNPILVIGSPNGGEVWQRGTVQRIAWKTSSVNVGTVDISLVPYSQVYCITAPCPMLEVALAHQIIAKGAPNTGAFAWTVGKGIESQEIQDGYYRVRVYAGDGTYAESSAPFKITSDTVANQPPVIMKMGGPTSLKTSESGTWTIGATDPEGGTLSYRVVWGDEVYAVPTASGAAEMLRTTQTATFSHAYANAGVYYPTFTVTDASGLSVTQKMSVKVGDTAGQPDLSVLDIYDDKGTLSVKIGNLGSGYAPKNTGHLYIWIDGQLKWTYSLGALYDQSFLVPGGTMVVQPQILSGTHTISATIDPNSAIAESDEGNNSTTKTLTFSPPPTVNQPPSITGVSGPTTLRVGETGVWTVTAKDPESKSLKYVVSWGEFMATSGAVAESSVAPLAYTQNATFSHVYGSAGLYTVSVRVYDDTGLSAMTSLTVNVTQ